MAQRAKQVGAILDAVNYRHSHTVIFRNGGMFEAIRKAIATFMANQG